MFELWPNDLFFKNICWWNSININLSYYKENPTCVYSKWPWPKTSKINKLLPFKKNLVSVQSLEEFLSNQAWIAAWKHLNLFLETNDLDFSSMTSKIDMLLTFKNIYQYTRFDEFSSKHTESIAQKPMYYSHYRQRKSDW